MKSKTVARSAIFFYAPVIFATLTNAFFDTFLSFLSFLSNDSFPTVSFFTVPYVLLQYIGPQFLSAIRPILGEDWTPDTEEAWTLLLGYMIGTMKRSLLEARNASVSETMKVMTPPPSSSSSSSTAAMDD